MPHLKWPVSKFPYMVKAQPHLPNMFIHVVTSLSYTSVRFNCHHYFTDWEVQAQGDKTTDCPGYPVRACLARSTQ